MTRSLPILLFASLISIGATLTTRFNRHVVHERRSETTTWTKHKRVDNDIILPMRIGLTQTNLDKGQDLLMELSHPESSKYGQWYTSEEVHELFAPSQESVDAVRGWLESSGIPAHRISQSANKQWIQFDAEAKEAENLLNTKYHVYKHMTSDRHSIGCDEYHVPENIQRHVDYITPGVKAVNVRVSSSTGKRTIQQRGDSNAAPPPGYSPPSYSPSSSAPPGYPSSSGIPPSYPSSSTAPPSYPYSTIVPPSYPYSTIVPSSYTSSSTASPSYTPSINVPDYGSSWFSVNNCTTVITPLCIRALYNFTQINSNPFAGNSLGIFESGDFYDQPDLDLFFKHLAPHIPQGTHPTLQSIDGGFAPVPQSSGGGESLLDFDLAFPLVYPIPITLYQTDDDFYSHGKGFQEYAGFLNTFLDAIDGSYCDFEAFGEEGNSPIDPSYPDDSSAGGYKGKLECGTWRPANVISLSYASVETGGGLPSNYEQRQCAEYMKLSMQGVTFVFSSGDGGVGHINAGSCDDVEDSQVFGPMFPASCPWVTSVGSTVLVEDDDDSSSGETKEVATRSFGSGGGFSNVFARPAYQDDAVEGYFGGEGAPTYPYYSAGSKYGKGVYNRTGRGIPDVSALGDNIVVFKQGEATTEGGTSASAPIFASLITSINEMRLKAGKTAVGFINPVLYAHPGAFHDVLEGNNPGCDNDGFEATEGWDPVTGLGTPDYDALLDVFMKLP